MFGSILDRSISDETAHTYLMPAMLLLLIQTCLAADNSNSRCKPQGFLKLDKPYEGPGHSEILFPYCEQHQQCSCCNASHVVAIGRSLQLYDIEPLSESCSTMTEQLACRICDPEVGTGLKQRVCARTCEKWFSRCRHDYFSFSTSTFSQQLVPCGTRQASAVCSTAEEFADSGQSFCQQAGYDSLDGDAADANLDCFDGTVPALTAFGGCTARPQKKHHRSNPGRSSHALYYVCLLAASFAFVLIYRRIAFIIRKQFSQPVPSTSKHQPRFQGRGRKLKD